MEKKSFPERKWRRALRLTFEYEGDQIRLIRQQSIDMIPPPPSTMRPQKKQSGFWYELCSKEGDLIYHRGMQNPIKFDVEVFDLPGKEITRHSVDRPSGIFQLLIPDTPEAHELVLFSSPLEPKLAQEPAKEIARFTLKPRREGKED